MPESWRFYLHQSNALNSNDRKHWGSATGPRKVIRTHGSIKARTLPKFTRARISVLVSYPDRTGRDAMNLYPVMKAYVDGLVDGGRGILPDDSDIYVSGPHLDWSGKLSDRREHFAFDVTVEDIEPMIPDRDAMGPAMLKKWLAMQPA